MHRRSVAVPGEYAAKARAMDLELGVDVTSTVGPVSRRLQEVGPVISLCFGGFAEVSEGVHELVKTLAQERLKKEGLALGRQGSDGRLGQITGQIRRRLSQATVRANMDCMLARLSMVGDGVSEASKRRNWQRREEDLMRREREASWRAVITGHSTVRRGRFLLD